VFPVSFNSRRRGRCLLVAAFSTVLATLILKTTAAAAQNAAGPQQAKPAQPLPQISVSGRRPVQRGPIKRHPTGMATAVPANTNQPPPAQPLAGIPMTPLNDVPQSATRLGLPVIQTPASVEVVTERTIQEQGYRTTTDTAQGAVGVLSGDSAGAPASFSMRGFSGSQINILYNGIWTGPGDITSRWMDTAGLAQVEFLKGPSSIMSGLNAIGGSINYVNKQPTSGPVRNEIDASVDSFGSFRTHLGSGGNTGVQGLDYRFDAVGSKLNSFIDGDFRDLAGLAAQLNYRVTADFAAFAAFEYKNDYGHAYWGTPLVPVSFAGSHAVSGVVSGTAVSTFDGSIIGPLTIDSRTLTTNYNVADNATGAHDLWLRGGFAWTPLANVTVKDQYYSYQAKRSWFDSETYAFNNATATIDRDRFFVAHNQHIIGNNADLTWDTLVFGMDNRFAAQLQASSNWITFEQEGNPDAFPADTVSVINPSPGVYGPEFPNTRNSRLTDVAGSFEDRLKITPVFALIGGVRLEQLTLNRFGVNFDGTIPDGQPFSKTWKPVSYRAAYTYSRSPASCSTACTRPPTTRRAPPSSPSRRTHCN
jgi:iron complex outermembrane recepter protein